MTVGLFGRPMKILIVSDAWLPQVNGVVRSLQTLKKELEKMGHQIHMVTPNQFFSVPCPTYPEISLAFGANLRIKSLIEREKFDCIHLATEGPLGLAAKQVCQKKGLVFTTAFHTRFPEYIHARFGIPTKLTMKLIRWFHSSSESLMVSTVRLRDELEDLGFKNLKIWSRGVDTETFYPRNNKDFFKKPGPHYLYVGRVAIEKNLEAFLNLDIPGTKHVVGDGPQKQELSEKYPEVEFAGMKVGDELAEYYSAADVFVFPSKTDTFGLVMLEAMASGTPVAALPVPGPLDVIGLDGPGALYEDLGKAIQEAQKIPPEKVREFALKYSWENSAKQFLKNLAPITYNKQALAS